MSGQKARHQNLDKYISRGTLTIYIVNQNYLYSIELMLTDVIDSAM